VHGESHQRQGAPGSPRGGTPVGPQAGGHPGQRRRLDRGRDPAQHHEATGRGPAATAPVRMTEGVTRRGWLRPGGPLRTSQGAAIAGIVFGVFLITALVLLRLSVPAHSEVAGAWLTDSWRRTRVVGGTDLL